MSCTASPAGDTPAETPFQPITSLAEFRVVIALALLTRAVLWFKRPPDMDLFLEPWFNHILYYGPIQAFAHPFSNYEPAYLYLLALGTLIHGPLGTMTIIKLISVAGTLFLTWSLANVLEVAGVRRRGALFLLVLPSVIINDALLAQCDALWAGACICGLAAMARGRTLRAMIWCGVAIAFKAQAAFMAPVIIGAMIGRRAPWWHWGIPVAVFLATLVPAWLMGWPGFQLLTVYWGQMEWNQIAGRLANPWMIGTIFGEATASNLFVGGYLAAGAAAATIAALAAGGSRNHRTLILLAALSGTALPFLLPKMLERYYFLGDVMTLALALTWADKKGLFALRAMQIASVLSHISYLYFIEDPYPTLMGALSATAALVVMCQLAAPDFKALLFSIRAAIRRRFLPEQVKDQSLQIAETLSASRRAT